jgi:hypothetical protein
MNGCYYKFFVSFIVIVYGIINTSGGDFFYMCITEEGQVRLEYALDGGCLPAGYAKAELAPTLSLIAISQNDGCGNCTDISLTKSLYIRSNSKIESLLLQHCGGAIDSSAEQTVSAFTTLNKEFTFSAVLNPGSGILRSVVLLI